MSSVIHLLTAAKANTVSLFLGSFLVMLSGIAPTMAQVNYNSTIATTSTRIFTASCLGRSFSFLRDLICSCRGGKGCVFRQGILLS